MRTIVVEQRGRPEKLMMREVPVSRPLPGQVRLRTILCSVNVADVPSFTANRSAAGQP